MALLSNGEEPSKGPEDVVAAHAALTANPGAIDFVGNVEGFAIGKGVATCWWPTASPATSR